MDYVRETVLLGLGALTGFVLSVAFWWIWNHRIIPDIRYSDAIARRSGARSEGALYRIKFKNAGRRRAIDINVRCRIAIFELGLKNTWSWFDLATNAAHVPELRRGGNRLIVLRPQETPDFGRTQFPEPIRRKLAEGSLTLEDVLALGTKAFVTTYIFAYDEFSGARKLFNSPRYALADIRDGVFRDLKVVGAATPAVAEAEVIEHDPLASP